MSVPGLTIAAAIATLIAGALYGFVLWRITPPADRRVVLLALLVMLPMQPLAYYFVRMPLHGLLYGAMGPGVVLLVISLWYAPLIEEPAKWAALLVPPIRRALNPANAIALSLAAGLGFGIGEIWFLAHRLAQSPELAALPFYMFLGFVVERTVVCFLHGAFIVFAFRNLAAGRSFLLGGAIGIALHFALNFPIFLTGIDWLGLGVQAWQSITLLWIAIFTLVLALWVRKLIRRPGP